MKLGGNFLDQELMSALIIIIFFFLLGRPLSKSLNRIGVKFIRIVTAHASI